MCGDGGDVVYWILSEVNSQITYEYYKCSHNLCNTRQSSVTWQTCNKRQNVGKASNYSLILWAILGTLEVWEGFWGNNRPRWSDKNGSRRNSQAVPEFVWSTDSPSQVVKEICFWILGRGHLRSESNSSTWPRDVPRCYWSQWVAIKGRNNCVEGSYINFSFS